MRINGYKPIMSSLCDKKLDKYVTRMSQIYTKYATNLYTKSTTGAIDKNDYLAKGCMQKKRATFR